VTANDESGYIEILEDGWKIDVAGAEACRTNGALRSYVPGTQCLRAGLICVAPLALAPQVKKTFRGLRYNHCNEIN